MSFTVSTSGGLGISLQTTIHTAAKVPNMNTFLMVLRSRDFLTDKWNRVSPVSSNKVKTAEARYAYFAHDDEAAIVRTMLMPLKRSAPGPRSLTSFRM